MRHPNHSLTVRELLVCVKPGRLLLMKLCIPILAVVGIVALGAVIWAQFSFYDLNEIPWTPRLALAAVALLTGTCIFKSLREEEVQLKIDFYHDRMVFTHDRHPSLWREDEPGMVTELLYKDITGCIFSTRRLRVTFRTRGYTQTLAGEEKRTKTGEFSFSTLKAPDTNFAGLIEKYSPVKVAVKN